MLCGSGLQLAAEEEEDDPQPLGDDGDEGTDSVPTDDSSFDVTQSEPSEGEFIRNLTCPYLTIFVNGAGFVCHEICLSKWAVSAKSSIHITPILYLAIVKGLLPQHRQKVEGCVLYN